MENGANATQSKQTFQRRTIFIKKGLQYRYMAMIFFSVLVGFLIVCLEVTWNLSRILAERPALVQPLLDELGMMVPFSLLKMVIYLVIVLIVSSVISHKMAGPVYKFEKSAGTVAGGDLTHRVFLRKGDQLIELQEQFNRMIASIHEKVRQDRRSARDVEARLRELAAKAPDAGFKAELERAADEAATITGKFTV